MTEISLHFTHRDNSKCGVHNSSPDGGIDWLLNLSFFKDHRGIVENLKQGESHTLEFIHHITKEMWNPM